MMMVIMMIIMFHVIDDAATVVVKVDLKVLGALSPFLKLECRSLRTRNGGLSGWVCQRKSVS